MKINAHPSLYLAVASIYGAHKEGKEDKNRVLKLLGMTGIVWLIKLKKEAAVLEM